MLDRRYLYRCRACRKMFVGGTLVFLSRRSAARTVEAIIDRDRGIIGYPHECMPGVVGAGYFAAVVDLDEGQTIEAVVDAMGG